MVMAIVRLMFVLVLGDWLKWSDTESCRNRPDLWCSCGVDDYVSVPKICFFKKILGVILDSLSNINITEALGAHLTDLIASSREANRYIGLDVCL